MCQPLKPEPRYWSSLMQLLPQAHWVMLILWITHPTFATLIPRREPRYWSSLMQLAAGTLGHADPLDYPPRVLDLNPKTRAEVLAELDVARRSGELFKDTGR